MDYISAVILGLVEGLTEFLPVSSTAHLLLVGDLLQNTNTDFWNTFSVFIQSGAMFAVLALYARDIFSKKFFFKICVAVLPTFIIGYFAYPYLTFLYDSLITIGIALLLGGFFMLVFPVERYAGTNSDISYFAALKIGLLQSVAIVPGVSRSLSTIYGGTFFGLTKELSVKFSFLVAVPTIVAAGVYDLYSSDIVIDRGHIFLLAVGFVVSFVSAYLVVRWFLDFVRSRDLAFFAYYRIALGSIILFYLLI